MHKKIVIDIHILIYKVLNFTIILITSFRRKYYVS
nr:MAG TPA: hypothetical protein [Bacteriophage sp.]